MYLHVDVTLLTKSLLYIFLKYSANHQQLYKNVIKDYIDTINYCVDVNKCEFIWISLLHLYDTL